MKHVKIDYFKINGKYYTTSSTKVESSFLMHDVVALVEKRLDERKAPGLSSPHSVFVAVVELDGLPAIVFPKELRKAFADSGYAV